MNRYLCLVFIISVLFLRGSVIHAQVFSLDLPTNPMNPGFNNQLTLNGNFQNGNTVLSDATTAFRTDYLDQNFRITLELNYEHGTNTGVQYAHNGQSLIRCLEGIPSTRFELEGVVSTQYDAILQLDNRFIYGAGVRINLFGIQDSQVTTNLTYGLGLISDTETNTNMPQTSSIRIVNYIAFLWNITPTITLNTTTRSRISLQNSSDHLEDFIGKISIPLLAQFTLNLELDLNYDSEPAPGVKKWDTQFINGLTWSF